ncbi:MAG: PAS domain S-box protein [Candidatus Thorarchaeota archaeon]|jgi:PAS domain S-box-containing protein
MPPTQSSSGSNLDAAIFRSIVSKSSIGVLIIQKDKILYANATAAEMAGVSLERIRRWTMNDVFQNLIETDREKAQKLYEERVGDGSVSQELIFSYAHSSGKTRAVSVEVQEMDVGEEPALLVLCSDVTEVIEAKEGLRLKENDIQESEQQYQLILESLGDAIHVVERDMTVILQNQAMYEWLSTFNLKQEIVGVKLIDAFPHLSKETLNEYEQVFRTGKSHFIIQKPPSTLGELVVEVRKIPLLKAGKVEQVITVIRDVTEQHNAEAALRESEMKYRSLFDNAADEIYIHDLEGVLLAVNPIACERLGYAQEELLEMTISEIDSDTAVERIPKIMKEIMDNKMARFESEHLAKDGSIYPIEVNARLIEYEGQSAIQSSARDISTRKVAEKALQESEAKYSQLFIRSNDAIFLHDLDGRIIDANDRALQLFQFSISDMLQLNIAELHPESVLEASAKAFTNIVKEESVRFEIEFKKKNGEIFTADVSANLISIAGERVVQGIVRDITEKKMAETALRESQEQFSMFANTVPGPVFIKDKDSNIIYVNQYMIDSMGAHDWVGKSTLKIFPKQLAQEMIESDQKALREGLTEIRQVVPDKNGIEHVYKTYKFPLKRIDKEPLLCGISLDITELVRAEEALRESEERFRLLYENLSDGVFLTNSQGLITMAGERSQEIFGYSPEELVGTHFSGLVHPDEREGIINAFRERIISGGEQKAGLEVKGVRKDGSEFFFHITNTLLFEDDKPAGFQSLIRDVSDRKEVLEALREQKERYQVLFDASPIAIGVSDPAGNVKDTNRQMEELLGYSKEEHKEMGVVATYVDPKDRPGLIKLLDDTGKVRDFSVKLKRKDGQSLDILINVDRIEFGDGTVLLSTMRDVTELSRISKELEEAHARAEFFNDLMAHDLNNIHQGILSSLELLMLKPEFPEGLQDLSCGALDQAQRAIMLIANVKKLAKIEKSTTTSAFDLYTVIEKSIELVTAAFPRKIPEIEMKLEKNEYSVLADEFLLEVFYNLLHNSLKSDPKERVQIEIAIDKVTDDNQLIIKVMDKGPGISNSRKKSLFTRLERSTTSGSGIGLTLVRRILDHYGGSIKVENRVLGDHTQGVCFVLSLPLSERKA